MDCAIVLGVDQRRRPNRPFGASAPEDPNAGVEDKLTSPSQVLVMDPAQLEAVMSAGITTT